MLEQQHRAQQRVAAAQRQRQRLGPRRGQPGRQHPPGQRRRGQDQQQPQRQEIPRLQPHDAHHAHRGVGDIHSRHGAHAVQCRKDAQPAQTAAAQGLPPGRTQQRSGQQHQRPGQVQERNGQILPAEQPGLPQETVVLIECAQQHGDITQRVLQNKGQLPSAVDRRAALAGDRAVVVPHQHAVLFHKQRHCQRTGGAQGHPGPAAAFGGPFPLCQQQRQRHPQQVEVGFGAVGKDAGQRIQQRLAGGPAGAGQQRQHQVIAAQQRGVVTQRRAHIQRDGQQHDAKEGGPGFLRRAQPQPAQQRVGQQVAQPPCVQAAQGPQPRQAGQRHAQRPRQEGQDQEADGLGDGVAAAVLPAEIPGETVGDALHRAVLAVLFEGVARGVVGLFLAGVGVLPHPGGGMGVHPRAGERLHQPGHVLGVAALGVKVEAAHGDGVGAQVMFGLVGGLQRRVGKDEQRPAQQDADRAAAGKVPDLPQRQRGPGRPRAQHRTEGRGPQRRDAPGVQAVKDAPVIAERHARQRAQRQHESPPHGFGPDGG